MMEYNKEINLRLRKQKGDKYYYHFYDIEHPLANKCGIIYHHRHVMSLKIGRWLERGEQVHHIDFNSLNNDPSNLEILTASKHTEKHHLEKGDGIKRVVTCTFCKIEFKQQSIKQEFCSRKCWNSFQRNTDKEIIKPCKEELEELVSVMSLRKTAKLLDVSFSTIDRWCKNSNINCKNRRRSSSLV